MQGSSWCQLGSFREIPPWTYRNPRTDFFLTTSTGGQSEAPRSPAHECVSNTFVQLSPSPRSGLMRRDARHSNVKRGWQGDGHMRIVMVLTSHDQLGDTGRPTGFW